MAGDRSYDLMTKSSPQLFIGWILLTVLLTGATIGYFPVDLKSLEYLRQTNRDEAKIQMIQKYLAAVGMLR